MLQEAWGEVPSDYLEKLTARLRKVCQAAIATKGVIFFTLQVRILHFHKNHYF